MDFPVTLFDDIEVAAVREATAIFEFVGLKGIAERSDGKRAIRPAIHAAVMSGKADRKTMSSFSTTIDLTIVAISTHPLNEANRRSELYPAVIAILQRFSGLQLTDKNGVSLPIKRLVPTGKWGQSSEEGEFLSYAIPFSTEIVWNVSEEIGIHDLKMAIGYEMVPGDDVAEATDEIQLNG